MSGLTLGFMSLGLVDLEILQRSGTVAEKKQAGSNKYTMFSAPMTKTYILLGMFGKDIVSLEKYLHDYFTNILKKLKDLRAQSKQSDFYMSVNFYFVNIQYVYCIANDFKCISFLQFYGSCFHIVQQIS